ncbi:nuclear transport factor 2 family protein [Gordonia sp. CPCC 205515]|uniref:nuclear transport factor 2 family protein n=1 Tax=Gordonia sp. CPCC 205515 TaxID=3140791 RepID=UPI003AF3E3DF
MTTTDDITAITNVVLRERASRDTAQWEAMRSCFTPDSHVQLSWFTGTGPEFTDASQRMYDAGSRSFHDIGAVSVDIVGDRALAHEPCAVHAQGSLAGVAITLTSHGRLYQRLIRTESGWRIAGLTMLYYQDIVGLTNPADDPSPLAGYEFPTARPFKYLAAVLAERGYTVDDDIPGTDRPEVTAQYLDAHHRWLHGGS